MSNLLIHSMAEFEPLIAPCLEAAKIRTIAEIGSEFGGSSRMLAQHCIAHDGQLTCIDPSPKSEFLEWVQSDSHVDHVAKPSIDAFEDLCDIDAWVIDGDHNYYTVIRELRAVDAAASRDKKPLLAFMHDVSWPCGRRDFYYAPERVPPEHRHPYSYDHGVTLGNRGVIANRGMRGMDQFAVALHEGGEGNGVLTAIEDFLSDADTPDRPLFYVHVPAVFGLGVIFDASASWSEDIAQFLLPFHHNPLMARLEENRLQNYLAVIDWQDRTSDAAA